MALNITKSRMGGVTVLHLSGAILFDEESKSLIILVKDLLNKTPQIVLDLSDVTRIDSGGLGTLVALYVSARKVGVAIRFANLGNHAKEVLQITRLETVFEIFGTTEEAIASFKVATAKG
jgi:anti-sigma B factor antagonist